MPHAPLTLVAALAFAQQPLLQNLVQNQPIRVATRVVQLNVIARNNSGQPVTDLSKDDFAVFDNGKTQAISFFALEPRPVRNLNAPPRPPDTFSNRTENGAEAQPAITLLLFDVLNTRFSDQVYAQRQVIDLMRQISPTDRVGLYILGRQLKVLYDFGDDPKRLAEVLASFRGGNSRELAGAEANANDRTDLSPAANTFQKIKELVKGAEQVASDYYNLERADLTFAALEAIAKRLAPAPGRKNLIWISGGFPFTLGLSPEDLDGMASDSPNRTRRSFDPELEKAARAINDANVAIYPVDARGLQGNPSYDASKPAAITRPNRIFTPPNLDTMQNLASRTGGRVFYNTNDLRGAIQTAMDDGRVTYTLGFYPESEPDGKFHKLRVEVKRKGINLRYRQGYFAFAADSSSGDEHVRQLQEAVANPVEGTAVGLSVHIESRPPGSESWQIVTTIDMHDITLAEQTGKWAGKLEIVYSLQSQAGREIAGTRDAVNLNLKPEIRDKVLASGFPLHKTFMPSAEAAKLRIIVYDVPTGRTGSVSIPIQKT